MPLLILATLLGAAGTVTAEELDALLYQCELCHGQDGVSTDRNVPTIAGQPEALIANAHEQFKDWARPCTRFAGAGNGGEADGSSMCSVAASLDSGTINRIAEYYSGKTFRAAVQSFDRDLAVQGAQLHQMYCASCHPNGGGTAGYAGRLGGQWIPYLRRAIAQIRQEEMQVPSIMEHKMSQFSDTEIEALLHFWASQQE